MSTPVVPGSALGRWATGTFRPGASDVGVCVRERWHGRADGEAVAGRGATCFLFWVEELGFGASLGILVACPWRARDEGGRVAGVPLLRGVPAGAAR